MPVVYYIHSVNCKVIELFMYVVVCKILSAVSIYSFCFFFFLSLCLFSCLSLCFSLCLSLCFYFISITSSSMAACFAAAAATWPLRNDTRAASASYLRLARVYACFAVCSTSELARSSASSALRRIVSRCLACIINNSAFDAAVMRSYSSASSAVISTSVVSSWKCDLRR